MLVQERFDSTHYLLRPAGLKDYKFDFDTAQDFNPGEMMMGIEYEQRLGKKHIIRADFCPAFCDAAGRRIVYRQEIATNVGQ